MALPDSPAKRLMQRSGRDWKKASSADLVSYILDHFHALHREQLPALIQQARRVEIAHPEHPDCPTGLAEHLHALHQELESHMRKEEMTLFPLITQDQLRCADEAIHAIRVEHGEQVAAIRQIESLTEGLVLPTDRCATWSALYHGLHAFREDLLIHIHLENNVLFERFTVDYRH